MSELLKLLKLFKIVRKYSYDQGINFIAGGGLRDRSQRTVGRTTFFVPEERTNGVKPYNVRDVHTRPPPS